MKKKIINNIIIFYNEKNIEYDRIKHQKQFYLN